MAQPLGARQRLLEKKKKKKKLMSTRDVSRFSCIEVCFSKTFDVRKPQILKAIFTDTGKIGDEALECSALALR